MFATAADEDADEDAATPVANPVADSPEQTAVCAKVEALIDERLVYCTDEMEKYSKGIKETFQRKQDLDNQLKTARESNELLAAVYAERVRQLEDNAQRKVRAEEEARNAAQRNAQTLNMLKYCRAQLAQEQSDVLMLHEWVSNARPLLEDRCAKREFTREQARTMADVKRDLALALRFHAI